MLFPEGITPHLLAILWFLICWVGYTHYSRRRALHTPCLASVMHLYREDWMRRMLMRENRIADANVIGNLERNASFFASSALIVVAGLLTALGAADRTASLLADLPFTRPATQAASELKLLCLSVLFVYSFFTFTWCMRQYNFASVLINSAPMATERNVSDQARKAFADRAAGVMSMAANQFNYGLRSYYFGLAALMWFIGPWWFMLASTGVVFILYHREFHSRVLQVMLYTPASISAASEDPADGKGAP